MTITIGRDSTFDPGTNEPFGLDCPHCGVFAHLTPASIPNPAALSAMKPDNVGLVFHCDACQAPVFLRFPVRRIDADRVELSRNFSELERPRERFQFSYLPDDTEVLFREALSCFSHNNFNAFASMCRRACSSAFRELGDNGRFRAYNEVVAARDIVNIDDNSFDVIKRIIFDSSNERDLPVINRAQAGILLEVLKDMFYQCFVRREKLTRAIRVRRFFVQSSEDDLQSSA